MIYWSCNYCTRIFRWKIVHKSPMSFYFVIVWTILLFIIIILNCSRFCTSRTATKRIIIQILRDRIVRRLHTHFALRLNTAKLTISKYYLCTVGTDLSLLQHYNIILRVKNAIESRYVYTVFSYWLNYPVISNDI